MDSVSTAAAVGGFFITFGVAIFTLFRFVAASADNVRKEIHNEVCDTEKKMEAIDTRLDAELRAIRTETDLKLDRVVAVSDRARHDDKNMHAGQFLKLEQAIGEISKTAVRKEDMARMERTLDALSDKIGRQAVLESQLGELIKKLDKFEPTIAEIQSRRANI